MNIFFLILVFYICVNTCIFTFIILPYIIQNKLIEDKRALVWAAIISILFLPILWIASMFDKDNDEEE